MEAQLKITEGDLRAALENQEQLKGEKHSLEHTLNSTKTQVTEQSTALQVSQEKLNVLKVQMNDAEKSKVSILVFLLSFISYKVDIVIV